MLNLSSGEEIASPSADDFLAPSSGRQTIRPAQADVSLKSSGDETLRSAYGKSSFEASLVNPWRNVVTSPRPKAALAPIYDHAAPISPLRDRDIAELSGLFDREDILELEQNVNHYLIRLFPEPCWEDDDDLSFLNEHL
ncbi:hypothetical protein [Phormidesmis sp. 146-33]